MKTTSTITTNLALFRLAQARMRAAQRPRRNLIRSLRKWLQRVWRRIL